MIEVKPEAASCWGSTMADHTKVDSDIKQESEMRRTDRDHQAPCAELTASPPAGGFSAAPNVCLAPAGPSDGLCKPESKSPSLTDLRTPQQQPSLQSELYLSSLNQKVSSEKTCSYFQQKIPTWRQDCTMPVQDLGYPTDCAMFPPPRHQASPPYNMNTLGAFGYGQPGHQGQFAQDYGQFPVTDPGLQQQGATPTCSWPGYFAGGPAAGGMPSAGSRAGSVDDYSGVYTTQAPNTAAGAYASPYHSRPGTMPLHSMQSDYSGTPSVSSAMGHSPLGGSPSPSHMSGMVGMVGANNAAVAQRQQSARPYDWLKKQSYPAAPSSGKTRTKDKYRVVYTDHQRLELEKEFYSNRYITIRRKAELAGNLGLSERQVKIWFQNRRAKERKQNKKREEQAGKTQTQSSPLSSGAGSVIGQSPLSTPQMLGVHPDTTAHAQS